MAREARDMRERRDVYRMDSHLVSPVLPVSLGSAPVDASDGLFGETCVAGRVENEKEKVRLKLFCQHRKIPWAEFTRLR